MARRLPVLPRGDHLRRQHRDPAQHHRPPRARPGPRAVSGDDARLFEESLRKTIEKHSGPGLDTALTDFGWRDALADDRQLAVSTLFRLQGETNASSTALDDVLVTALGLDVSDKTAVLLPRIGRVDAPGRRAAERI